MRNPAALGPIPLGPTRSTLLPTLDEPHRLTRLLRRLLRHVGNFLELRLYGLGRMLGDQIHAAGK